MNMHDPYAFTAEDRLRAHRRARGRRVHAGDALIMLGYVAVFAAAFAGLCWALGLGG